MEKIVSNLKVDIIIKSNKEAFKKAKKDKTSLAL